MKRTTTYFLIVIVITSGQIGAQCISGLSPSYCANSNSSALTSTVNGGYFYGNGVMNAAFHPSVAGVGTHTINYGFCSGAYSVAAGPFTPLNVVGQSAGITGDDQLGGSYPIGFSFDFFCNTYTNFYISSNGYITFNGGSGNGCCTGMPIPTGGIPDDFIALAWEDFNPSAGGSITYTTVGTTPNRVLVVKYDLVPHYNNGGSPLTGQIQLYESTNVIEIYTYTMTTDGGNHTQGIENLGSTTGTFSPGRNANGSWSAQNDMYRFTPVPFLVCSATTTVSPASISVSGNQIICTGSSTSLTAQGNNTYTWTQNATTISNNAGVLVSPTSNTTYSVNGTNAFGCVTGSAVTVTVNTGAPLLSVNASTPQTCLGNTLMLTATGAVTYTWSHGITNGVVFTPGGTNIYTVSGQNPCGISNATTTIPITPLAISIAANPPTVCAQFASNLSATGASGYTWSAGAGTGSQVTVVPPASTTYTVSGKNGVCTGTAGVFIQVNPNPTLTMVGSHTRICAGESVTITVGGANTYSWNPPTLSGLVSIVSPQTSTAYAVTGANSFNCTDTKIHLVVVDHPPALTGNFSSTLVCPGAQVNISATGANSYTWSNNHMTASQQVTATSNTVYTLMATGITNTCVASKTFSVNVADVQLPVSSSTNICEGGAATFTAGGVSQMWSPGGAFGGFVTFMPLTTTVYTVSADVVAGSISCPAQATVQITVHPNPTVSLTAAVSTVVCRGEPAVITASGASTYSWSVVNAGQGATATFTSNSMNIHNVNVMGTDQNGCSDGATIQVRVIACTGLADLSAAGIKLYPNPNNGRFSIASERAISVQLLNGIGQVIAEFQLDGSNQFKADVADLAPGNYFIAGDGFRASVIVTR